MTLEREGNMKIHWIICLKQVNFVVWLLYLSILVNKIKNHLKKVRGKEGSGPKFGDGGAVLLLLRCSGGGISPWLWAAFFTMWASWCFFCPIPSLSTPHCGISAICLLTIEKPHSVGLPWGPGYEGTGRSRACCVSQATLAGCREDMPWHAPVSGESTVFLWSRVQWEVLEGPEVGDKEHSMSLTLQMREGPYSPDWEN